MAAVTLQLLPDSERFDHHVAVERLVVGHACNTRVSMRAAAVVRQCELHTTHSCHLANVDESRSFAIAKRTARRLCLVGLVELTGTHNY